MDKEDEIKYNALVDSIINDIKYNKDVELKIEYSMTLIRANKSEGLTFTLEKVKQLIISSVISDIAAGYAIIKTQNL